MSGRRHCGASPQAKINFNGAHTEPSNPLLVKDSRLVGEVYSGHAQENTMTARPVGKRGAAVARGASNDNKIGIWNISEALIASGFISLDDQAKALGLSRSTAWTIINAKHKVGRLSAKVSAQMLANPGLPSLVRATLQGYLAERTSVAKRVESNLAGPITEDRTIC